GKQILRRVCFLVDGLIPAGRPIAEECIPVVGLDYFLEHGGGVSNSVKTADNTAHAGSRDDIGPDSRLFQYFQHADMCKSLCTAAAQSQSYFHRLIVARSHALLSGGERYGARIVGMRGRLRLWQAGGVKDRIGGRSGGLLCQSRGFEE